MASAERIVAVAIAASDDARRQLRARGRDPAAHAPLLLALEEGVCELLGAQNWIREWEPVADEVEWRRHLAEVRHRLEADPPERHAPVPPRRPPPALIVDLIVSRGQRGVAG